MFGDRMARVRPEKNVRDQAKAKPRRDEEFYGRGKPCLQNKCIPINYPHARGQNQQARHAVSQSLNRALAYSVTRLLVLPTGVWIVYWYTFVLQTGLPSTIKLFVASWFGLGLVTDIFFWPYARHAVTKHFRALASGEAESMPSMQPIVAPKRKTMGAGWPPNLRFRFLKSRLILALIF